MEASNSYLEDHLEDRAVLFKPKAGQVLRIKGSTITLKVTSSISRDQLGIYEITLEPGRVGADLHYHRFMDETFLINDGVLAVKHGRDQVDAEAGSVIYIPRFTPHGFANHSDKPVTVTLLFNPAQNREGFFFGLERILNRDTVDPGEFLALYNKYDSYPVDVAGK